MTFVLWFGINDRKGNRRQSGTVPSIKKGMIDLGIIFRNKQIWVNGMYGCLVYLPTTVFAELWGIPYLKHAHGLTSSSCRFSKFLVLSRFYIGRPTDGLYFQIDCNVEKFPMLIGAGGAAMVMMMILYLPGLNQTNIQVLMFLLGLLYSAQCYCICSRRELSPGEAAGTAMAVTNMIVMLGAMLLQPLVGHLLDYEFICTFNGPSVTGATVDNLQNYIRWMIINLPCRLFH